MNLSAYIYKAGTVVLIAAFGISLVYIAPVQAGELTSPLMPPAGAMVSLSQAYVPALVQGITIHPDNALQFDFLIQHGDGHLTPAQKREEYTKLIKYFLASLTVPDQDQWVNLSPYEKGRIIEGNFGKTEMGRDLLEQDYLLKQITSTLMYPESGLGRDFWNNVYAKAWNEYHTTDIPVNTFNKVWIVPDQAVVYESGNTAYIIKSHLKVMLEEDYLSTAKHLSLPGDMFTAKRGTCPQAGCQANEPLNAKAPQVNRLTQNILREIIIPELTKEVNQGKNFAPLRQMVDSMILATWYKKALKESLLGKIYADKNKIKGVEVNRLNDTEAIYQQYLQAFKKGVYNYIKEDEDKYTHQNIPRKYFAGGFQHPDVRIINEAMITPALAESAQSIWSDTSRLDRVMVKMNLASQDQAMNALEKAQTDYRNVLSSVYLNQTLLSGKDQAEDLKQKRFNLIQAAFNAHIYSMEGIEPLFNIDGLSPEARLKEAILIRAVIRRELEPPLAQQEAGLPALLKKIAQVKTDLKKAKPGQIMALLKGFENVLSQSPSTDLVLHNFYHDLTEINNLLIEKGYYLINGPTIGEDDKFFVISRIMKTTDYEAPEQRIKVFFIKELTLSIKNRDSLHKRTLTFVNPGNECFIRVDVINYLLSVVRKSLEARTPLLAQHDSHGINHRTLQKLYERLYVKGFLDGKSRFLEDKLRESTISFAVLFTMDLLLKFKNKEVFANNDPLSRKISLAYALFFAKEPLYGLILLIEQINRNEQEGWEVLSALAGGNSPTAVVEWLEKILAMDDPDTEIRKQAAQYYETLTGHVPVFKFNEVKKEEPPSEKTIAISPGPRTVTQPVPRIFASDTQLRRALDFDRFGPVRMHLRSLFEHPESENTDGINKLIAKAKGRHSKDPYHDARQAIADAVASNGVTAYSLMSAGESGATRLEEQIAKVMRETDIIKAKFGNMSFRAYFNLIPAMSVPGSNGHGRVLNSRTVLNGNPQVQVHNEILNEAKGPELLILRDNHVDLRTRGIDEAKQKIFKIYRIIKEVEKGQMPVSSLNNFTQRTFPGIFRDDLKDDWAVYFRYFKQENKILVIVHQSKDEGHKQMFQLSQEFKDHLEAYSTRELLKVNDLNPKYVQSLGLLDAAMGTGFSAFELNKVLNDLESNKKIKWYLDRLPAWNPWQKVITDYWYNDLSRENLISFFSHAIFNQRYDKTGKSIKDVIVEKVDQAKAQMMLRLTSVARQVIGKLQRGSTHKYSFSYLEPTPGGSGEGEPVAIIGQYEGFDVFPHEIKIKIKEEGTGKEEWLDVSEIISIKEWKWILGTEYTDEIYKAPNPADSAMQTRSDAAMAEFLKQKTVSIYSIKKDKTHLYDRAMSLDNLGGIDLNSANMDLQIKRDGRGVPLPLSEQDMAQLSRIPGFVPVIIDIKPATNLPILSELKEKLQESA